MWSVWCVSHISGKDEIIFQEEFISSCGLWERWRQMPGYPTEALASRGGSLNASCLTVLEQKCQRSHALVCRHATFFSDFILFCKFLEKQPSERTLFCHLMLVEREHSWCNLKWQNHYTSVMKNASDILVFLLSWYLLSAAVLCTLQIFCRINSMNQGSEIWLGLSYFCRQLNLSIGLSEVWVSVIIMEKQRSPELLSRCCLPVNRGGKKGEND